MFFTLGLRCLATLVGTGTISRSSGIVRFVSGGVVKPFRCVPNYRMQIRTYQSDDRDMVVTLWEEVFPDSTGHNDPRASIERKVLASDGLFFVAIEDDAVIGTVLAGYDGHRGWLYSLAVAPTHRRNGVGTQLVRHAEGALAVLGCPKLNLQVRCNNSGVVAFYQSLGFDSEERISMGKRIDR